MSFNWFSPALVRRGGNKPRRVDHLQSNSHCVRCRQEGRLTPAVTVYRAQPFSDADTDAATYAESLCASHYAKRTGRPETPRHEFPTHPEWIKPSAVPLTIVCGPPASGKTTFVRENAKPGDIVIDLDSILGGLRPDYKHWSSLTLDKNLLTRALRIRNDALGSLKDKSGCDAWFIVAAPTQAERDWWAKKTGGKVVLMHPGIDELKRRALARGTPLAIQGIEQWEKRSRLPWKAR